MTLLLLLALLQAPAAAASATVPPGPSMEETKAWLETEALPLLGGDTATYDRIIGRSTDSSRISDLTLDACTLKWVDATSFTMGSGQISRSGRAVHHIAVPLKDLDIAGTKTVTDADSIPPTAHAVLVTRASAGKTIKSTDDKGVEQLRDGIGIKVKTAADADRVVKAVQRAATLCGAKSVF